MGSCVARADVTYMGCYKDVALETDKALMHFLGSEPVIMTVDECLARAVAGGYRYFGLENGNRCWGGEWAAYRLGCH